jgi:hypothetical protein
MIMPNPVFNIAVGLPANPYRCDVYNGLYTLICVQAKSGWRVWVLAALMTMQMFGLYAWGYNNAYEEGVVNLENQRVFICADMPWPRSSYCSLSK